MRVKAFRNWTGKYLAAAALSLGSLVGAQGALAASLSFSNDGDPSELLGTLTCSDCSALVFSGNTLTGTPGSFAWDTGVGEFFDLSLPFFAGVSDPLADLNAAANFANANLGTNISIDSATTTPGGGETAQSSTADAVLLSVGGSAPLFALLRNDNAPSGGGFTFTWMSNINLLDSTRGALTSFTEVNVSDLTNGDPVSTGPGTSGTGGGDQSTSQSNSPSPVPLPLSGLLLLGGLGGLALTRRKSA